ncbi:MAG: histidine phosphatase family protein [Candidatus Thorarchaeota archaeon]
MFEIVQEPDYGSMSRTIVYIVLHGEVSSENYSRLTEHGKEQVLELARSRLVSAPAKIYHSSNKAAEESAKILADELFSKNQQKDCLKEADFGRKIDESVLREMLPKIWEDIRYQPPSGESLFEAQRRFSTCINQIARIHPESSVAIVAQPLVFTLFYRMVVGGDPQVEDWLYSGFASCATYEYSKDGWTLIMPPENSFLSSPTDVSSSLPSGIF